MDPKAARKLLDEVYGELDPAREVETQRALEGMVGRFLRPIGLGLLLAAAPLGCDNRVPAGDITPPVGDAYGIPSDWRPPVGDAYGVPSDWRPPVADAYGIPGDWLPPVGDAYGVPSDVLPPPGDL